MHATTPLTDDRLPLRLLCLDPQEPSWTALAIALESQVHRPLRFRWCDTTASALTLLGMEQFDIIVVADLQGDESNRQPRDLPGVLQAIRSGGCDDPLLILADTIRDTDLALLAELDVEVLCTTHGWDSIALATWILRTIRRYESLQEQQRLSLRDHQRTHWEREESFMMLQQQREIMAHFQRRHLGRSMSSSDLPRSGPSQAGSPQCSIPPRVREYYLELLRTYVIMGAGNLTHELDQFSQGLVEAGVTSEEAFHLHLQNLTRLVEGLGSLSSRHVLFRSNLLALEFLLHMAAHLESQTARDHAGIRSSKVH